MRQSEFEAIRPSLERGIAEIDASFARERQSAEISKELERKFDWTARMPGNAPPTSCTGKPAISGPLIENAYPWKHAAKRASKDLADCGWSKEAGAIDEVLSRLPTEPVDGNQPDILARQLEAIHAGAERIRAVLVACLADNANPASDRQDDPDTPVSEAKLAERLGIAGDDNRRRVLRERLKEWRRTNDDGWIEVPNPKPREPRFLYQLGKVWPVVQDMKRSD